MLDIGGIVRIFEEIEQRLISSLKRNLMRHKREEKDEGFSWSAWQAEKLRSLERYRRENAAIMSEYADQIDTTTREIMEEQFGEGVNGADIPPAAAVRDAPAEIRAEPQFFGVDRVKVDRLIGDVTTLEKSAESAALRMTDDVYRQTVNRVQLAMATGSMSLQQAIDTAVKDFLDQGINCIVYKDGRRVNIADYVRMVLRTTATRAALQGKSAKYKALGYDTVVTSSYDMCSETCKPWQGRIYIDDTFTGWSGETRMQGDMLWGRSNYCGKWFPLLSEAIKRGLFHPNCRHSINLWRDGDPLPESIDNSDNERRYKLEQQQRALERAVRKAKRRAEGFTDPTNIKKAKAELRQAQKNLKDFIDKVNAEEGETVLKRDYGREKVYEGEVVSESGNSGKHLEKTDENTVDLDYIKSAEYKNKFKTITDNDKVNDVIYKQAKAALIHRNGTSKEDMWLINSETAAIEGKQTNSQSEYGVDYNNSLKNAIKRNKPYTLISLHNHPTNNPPTGSDLSGNAKKKYALGVVVTHKGKVYSYKAGEKPFFSSSFDKRVDKYRGTGYNMSEEKAILQALKDYESEYGIEWREH
ncbi:MAG: hypothetical protein IJ723_03325 [Ruminococcus sp.]|nr:hypothetical protein [Ruminococcus sp.]